MTKIFILTVFLAGCSLANLGETCEQACSDYATKCGVTEGNDVKECESQCHDATDDKNMCSIKYSCEYMYEDNCSSL